MGKYKQEKKKENHKLPKYPLVSICTPTFNRRIFIPFLMKCIEQQTYPKDKIEWIVIDDGTDPVGDLFTSPSPILASTPPLRNELASTPPILASTFSKGRVDVKYFYYDTKMSLGKKRNLMHSKCSGDVIVYMDDDDYYPPERIAHAVQMLQSTKYLLAGSSEMHIYFDSRDKIVQFGPYGKYHSTAAGFAFKKELLEQTGYNESQEMAEESFFTKNWTIPMIQLNPLKTILVFSHVHNSLNKETMLDAPGAKITDSRYNVDDFVKDPELKQFYMHNVNTLLKDYEHGNPEKKAELNNQIAETIANRDKKIQELNRIHQTNQMLFM